ncbi:hypothetical protein Glove_139g62 [Diversispora epigaea]|uniref:Uncharacterized protein n=1 Tax=Diversispora epigaea TaxID=1348612 RepID=A0A397IZX5_9GLOM|nr:hypothetical protein Glove_139g62 [Diversispora epigaea]
MKSFHTIQLYLKRDEALSYNPTLYLKRDEALSYDPTLYLKRDAEAKPYYYYKLKKVSDDEEIIPLSIKDAFSELEAFIKNFEQNDNSEFNFNDLRIFKKYLQISRVIEFESKKQ